MAGPGARTPTRPQRQEPTLGATLDAMLAALAPEIADRVADLVLERLAEASPTRSPWLDVAEAADYLRCKPKRIYDLVGQERLREHRDGSRLLFRREDLDAYLGGADTLLTPPAHGPQNGRARGASRIMNPRVNGAR